jgi:hypothetical protein
VKTITINDFYLANTAVVEGFQNKIFKTEKQHSPQESLYFFIGRSIVWKCTFDSLIYDSRRGDYIHKFSFCKCQPPFVWSAIRSVCNAQ